MAAEAAEPLVTAVATEEAKPTGVAVAPPAGAPAKEPIAVGVRGLDLRTFDDMWRFASAVDRGGWGPKGSTADSNLLAIQFGAELGVGPMQAVQNICVINGRPSAWGDLPLGICMRSPIFDHAEFREWFTGTPYEDDYTAHCQARRLGGNVAETTFSVADAKRAKLWGGERTTGIWQSYAKRMLMYRARGYRLRDTFPDVLKGLYTGEELSSVDEIMSRLDLGNRSEPAATESPEALRDRLTAPGKAPAPQAPTTDTPPKRRGRPRKEPAAEPAEPAEPATEPPPSNTEDHEDNPELLRKAILDKWNKINEGERKRILTNLGIIGITVVNTMTDAGRLREINDALIGEVPPGN